MRDLVEPYHRVSRPDNRIQGDLEQAEVHHGGRSNHNISLHVLIRFYCLHRGCPIDRQPRTGIVHPSVL